MLQNAFQLSLLSHQIVHEKEIQAEDDQVFLVKLQVRKAFLLSQFQFIFYFKSIQSDVGVMIYQLVANWSGCACLALICSRC